MGSGNPDLVAGLTSPTTHRERLPAMSFGDPYTLDDLLREIHHPTSGDRVTLTREQALDLDRGRNDALDRCCKRCRAKLAKADAA